MNHSKPGKRLNPLIANHTARIYARDPVRYRNLIIWVKRSQKDGWPDDAIALCLQMGDKYIDQTEDWYPYLNKLLPKSRGQATEAESQKHKSEIGYIANEFIEFLRAKRSR